MDTIDVYMGIIYTCMYNVYSVLAYRGSRRRVRQMRNSRQTRWTWASLRVGNMMGMYM